MKHHLLENQVLAAPGNAGLLLRILWLPPGEEEVALLDLADERALPHWEGIEKWQKQIDNEGLMVCDDPLAAQLRPNSLLSAAEIKITNARLATIKPLVSDPERRILDPDLRHKLILARSEETNTAPRHIYRFLRLWWRFGQQPNALVPCFRECGRSKEPRKPGLAKRGRPRYGVTSGVSFEGVNVDTATAEKLQRGIAFLKKRMSWSQAYNQTIFQHFSERIVEDGLVVARPIKERPSKDQFIYWCKKALSPGDVQRAVHGEAGYARKYRPKVGGASTTTSDLEEAVTIVPGPGELYQIDATVANVYLRSREKVGRRLIGRPVLYLVIDVYSRLIVGFTVGLSGPSWEVAKLALECAFTEKRPLCERYGPNIDPESWPYAVCTRLTGDRAWEVIGRQAAAAGGDIDFKITALPAYRPDLKGMVEGKFDFLEKTELTWIPGHHYQRDRGDPPNKLDGVWTIHEFIKFMVMCIHFYNHNYRVKTPPNNYRENHFDSPSPFALWQYGIKMNGAPKYMDRNFIRISLLHRGTARESGEGLKFEGLDYVPENPDRLKWLVRTPGRRWRSHNVRYDPRNMSQVHVWADEARAFEIWNLKDTVFRNRTLDEIKDVRASKSIHGRREESRTLSARATFEAQRDALSAPARTDAAMKGLRKASPDREARQLEQRNFRREEACTGLPPPPSIADPANEISEVGQTRPTNYDGHGEKLHDSVSELIRSRFNARRQQESER